MVLYSSHSSCKLLVFLCSLLQFCIIMLTVSSCWPRWIASRSARASGKVIIIRYFEKEKKGKVIVPFFRSFFSLNQSSSFFVHINNFH